VFDGLARVEAIASKDIGQTRIECRLHHAADADILGTQHRLLQDFLQIIEIEHLRAASIVAVDAMQIAVQVGIDTNPFVAGGFGIEHVGVVADIYEELRDGCVRLHPLCPGGCQFDAEIFRYDANALNLRILERRGRTKAEAERSFQIVCLRHVGSNPRRRGHADSGVAHHDLQNRKPVRLNGIEGPTDNFAAVDVFQRPQYPRDVARASTRFGEKWNSHSNGPNHDVKNVGSVPVAGISFKAESIGRSKRRTNRANPNLPAELWLLSGRPSRSPR
jgi:hypothetical protein